MNNSPDPDQPTPEVSKPHHVLSNDHDQTTVAGHCLAVNFPTD